MPDASVLSANPFAALTAVVGPAVLTNACSVLALGTSNRLARVVDRSRTVSRELASLPAGSPEYELRASQRTRLATRSQLLLKALRSFYAALGAFAAAALLLGLGSVVAASEYPRAFWFLATIAFTVGAAAVVGLAYGCIQMVRETGLAVRNLSEEAKLGGGG